jgi:hypothetical protein
LFNTVKKHLSTNGIFIFDCWYGPAVLTDRPVVRIKRLEDNNISVTRIAEPELECKNNLVNVIYDVKIRDKNTNILHEIKETHKMRYLFNTDIDFVLNSTGLKLVHDEEWMTGKPLGFDTWGSLFICS